MNANDRRQLRQLLSSAPLETRRALLFSARAAALQPRWTAESLDAVAAMVTPLEAPRGGEEQEAAEASLLFFSPAAVAAVAAEGVLA